MNSDGKNNNPAGNVANAASAAPPGSNENVNNGRDAKVQNSDTQAVDDSLVDPELNQQSAVDRSKQDDEDDDDDQINQIEDDNENIAAAAAAAAASNDINYLANMHAVENHMQNVLGGAGAGVDAPSSSSPTAAAAAGGVVSHGHNNGLGASAGGNVVNNVAGKEIKLDDNPNDADYNDDDEDDKVSSKTAIDAVVESNKVKKTVSNTKRAAQNRAAQRAFRQRRKTRIEQLENVELLYKAALQDVERLQAENEALKKQLTEINSK